MFTLSVITMIGYGNTVPRLGHSNGLIIFTLCIIYSATIILAKFRTEWGKIATMVYALFGIPVYILYFMNMGKVGSLWSLITTMIMAMITITITTFIINDALILINIRLRTQVFANMFKWVYRSVHGCMARRKAAAKYVNDGYNIIMIVI